MKLTYLGALRTPDHVFGDTAGPMTIDWARHEMVLFKKDRRVGRLTLPKPLRPRTVEETKLDRSSVLVAPLVEGSALADPSNNTWGVVSNPDSPQGAEPEGIQILGDKALITGSIYYDASGSQDRSLFVCDWPLTEQPPSPAWKSVQGIGEGWAAGPVTIIPEKWRAALGGDVLLGQPGGLPIAGRQSFGPCAIAMTLQQAIEHEDVPAKLLVGYTQGQRWEWNGPANDFWNSSTAYNSITFMGDCVVFIDRHGYGDACYGSGTDDPTKVGPGICYDPTNFSKGTHAYPYRVQGVGYYCRELADVAAGTIQPHEPEPFWFPIEFPTYGTMPEINVIGADYDSQRCELYVGVKGQDSYQYDPGPLIHVFTVAGVPAYPHPKATPVVVVPTPEPTPEPTIEPDLEEMRAVLKEMTEELAEANKVIDAIEQSRLAVILELEQEQTAHQVTRAAYEGLRANVLRLTASLEMLRNLE